MFNNYKIAVVIPAYNEEKLIKTTILDIPDIVDEIIVINDASNDDTGIILEALDIKKLTVITHKVNKGVGASIATGYKYSLKNNIDYTVIMAGDAQMDSSELIPMLKYMLFNELDYVKGNRFLKPWTLLKMPLVRIIGSLALNIMTKIATGYYHIGDPQSGYTIISLSALKKIKPNEIYRDYGYPNDILGKLALNNSRVRDFPISAIYKDEKSGLEPLKIIIPYSKLLFKIYKERRKSE